LPDLPIARIIFLTGILAVCLGLFGLPVRAGGRWLRCTAAIVTVAGLAASGTAVGLASSATLGSHGMVIPALHAPANDRPTAHAPDCRSAGETPICLNPAYGRYLTDVTSALTPALAEVAGVPDAPVRVMQVAATYDGGDGGPELLTITGEPPV